MFQNQCYHIHEQKFQIVTEDGEKSLKHFKN